jgi:hypothetical protein
MTVSKDKYDTFRQQALAGGAPAAEVELAIDDLKAVDTSIDEGACPHCHASLTRTLDPRQAGPTAAAGKWFNYRCLQCGWFIDRCEPVGEN